MNSFNFTQAQPLDTWDITHGLGSAVATDAMVNIGGDLKKIIPGAVEHIDDNRIIIRFSQPVSGEVRIVGIASMANFSFNANSNDILQGFPGPVDPEEPGDGGNGGQTETFGDLVVPSWRSTSGFIDSLLESPVGVKSHVAPEGIYLELTFYDGGPSSFATSTGTRPQRISFEMTSNREYSVTGSLDGFIGTGTVGTPFVSDVVTFLVTDKEGSYYDGQNFINYPALKQGDTFYTDLVYWLRSENLESPVADFLIKPSVVPESPESDETWTIEFISDTEFTVAGSVSGAQANGTVPTEQGTPEMAVGRQYENDFFSFKITTYGAVGYYTGEQWIIRFKNIDMVVHEETPPEEEEFTPLDPDLYLVTAGKLTNTSDTPRFIPFDGLNPGVPGLLVSPGHIDDFGYPCYVNRADIRPQRITIEMTTDADFVATASLDGVIGSGAVTTDAEVEAGGRIKPMVKLFANDPATTGDKSIIDLAYAIPSVDEAARIVDFLIKPAVLPGTAEGQELWTITVDSANSFTVEGSVSGVQPSGVPGAPYENDYIEFLLKSEDAEVGRVFLAQLSSRTIFKLDFS